MLSVIATISVESGQKINSSIESADDTLNGVLVRSSIKINCAIKSKVYDKFSIELFPIVNVVVKFA